MRKFNTLRVRLVLWTVLINAVLLIALGSGGWIWLRRVQNQELNDTLKLTAAQLAAAVDLVDGQVIVPASDTATLLERGVFGWVVDNTGEVRATIGRASTILRPVVTQGQLLDMQLDTNEPIRVYGFQLGESKSIVEVGISRQSMEQAAQRALLAFIIIMPVVLVLSALGGLFLSSRALSPIAAITTQARRIERDNLTERLSLSGPRDEVRELAQTFDEMLDRLQSAFETEQRFTSDASHELRTPLGLLKAQISLALSRPRDAAALTQMMQAMEGDVDRMTRLVETMLSLARTEVPLSSLVEVDLTELLSALVGQMQSAHSAHRKISLEAPPMLNTNVMDDPDRLTQLFMNLLDNAVKYSLEGTSIHVCLSEQELGWSIAITDQGIGIASEHLSHIFERFYRTDTSRARQTGGIGLGLPIAQAIAKQHGGRITVQSVLHKGSTFNVWLPKRISC